MKSKVVKSLLVVVVCVFLVLLCISMEHLLKSKAETETENNSYQRQEEYNGYGLPIGTELSDEIIYKSKGLVCYSDRAFYRFQYELSSIENIANMTAGLLDQCPQLKKIYVMPVPPRIVTEEGYEADKKNYLNYIKDLNGKLSSKVTLVDSSSTLEQHRDEYIFFRTEEAWTTRGAYYGTVSLLESMGKEYVSLNQYEEYMYTNFLGNMTLVPELSVWDVATIPVDPMYYYVLPNTLQRVEIINFNSMGKEERYKKPLFSPSLRNLATVIGGNYIRAIVDGECKFGEDTGKNLLVITDTAGKLVVPYLKDYYDTVYVVNICEDDMLYNDIIQILEEYNITEAVVVQNASNLGIAGYHLAMQKFYQTNQDSQETPE